MTLPPDQQPQPWVVYKPGGLSGTAHAVHIVLILLTLGLWLPVYIIFILAAPKVRTEVIVPYGAEPPRLDPAAEAEKLRKADAGERRAALIGLAVFGGGLAVIGIVVLGMALFR